MSLFIHYLTDREVHLSWEWAVYMSWINISYIPTTCHRWHLQCNVHITGDTYNVMLTSHPRWHLQCNVIEPWHYNCWVGCTTTPRLLCRMYHDTMGCMLWQSGDWWLFWLSAAAALLTDRCYLLFSWFIWRSTVAGISVWQRRTIWQRLGGAAVWNDRHCKRQQVVRN